MCEAAVFYMEHINKGYRSYFARFEEDDVVKAKTRSEEAMLKVNLGALIFDKEELRRVKDVILRYYIDLKNIYAYYSGLSPDYPCLNYDDVYNLLIGNWLQDPE